MYKGQLGGGYIVGQVDSHGDLSGYSKQPTIRVNIHILSIYFLSVKHKGLYRGWINLLLLLAKTEELKQNPS